MIPDFELDAIEGQNQQLVGDEGFTLMEMLVALTILSISLGVFFAVFSQSLDRTRHSQAEMKARVLAQSLLEQARAAQSLRVGQSRGDTDGLVWTVTVSPFGSAEEQRAWHNPLARVRANVRWTENGAEHAAMLQTLQLLPAKAAP